MYVIKSFGTVMVVIAGLVTSFGCGCYGMLLITSDTVLYGAILLVAALVCGARVFWELGDWAFNTEEDEDDEHEETEDK